MIADPCKKEKKPNLIKRTKRAETQKRTSLFVQNAIGGQNKISVNEKVYYDGVDTLTSISITPEWT